MLSDTLCPPNTQALSEDVIGSVVLRAWSSRRSDITELSGSQRKNEFEPSAESRSSTERTKRPLSLDDAEERVTEDEEDQISLEKLRDVDLEAYHRERRRRNQERYRRKQRKVTADLEADSQQLRDEIERLERQRNNLSYGVSTTETIWSVAAEYFRVFRRGLPIPDGERVELDFLRATMAPDMDAGTVIGLEALARNWRAFTEFFQNVQIQLGRLDQIAESSIVATATLHVTISKLSLHNMFPHLVSAKHKILSSIGERLLGQRLVMRVSVRFDWDSTNNRVVSLISQGDMVSPMLQVLGSLEDVSLAFSKALVKPDCNLVVGDYLSQYTLCY